MRLAGRVVAAAGKRLAEAWPAGPGAVMHRWFFDARNEVEAAKASVREALNAARKNLETLRECQEYLLDGVEQYVKRLYVGDSGGDIIAFNMDSVEADIAAFVAGGLVGLAIKKRVLRRVVAAGVGDGRPAGVRQALPGHAGAVRQGGADVRGVVPARDEVGRGPVGR